MTTELERRLREALHEDAERARLVNPGGPPDPGDTSLVAEEDPRRPGRWIVATAAMVLLALLGGLTMLDREQTVDTTPATTMPVEPAPRTVVSGSGCPFGIMGDPIDMQLGPVDPDAPRFDTTEGQGVAHTLVGSQVIEVRVPGFELTDPDGWRMEDIELARGKAKVWLDGPASGEQEKPFVQVRSFPTTDEPCSSFTVTVDGGTEAQNRQTAIDFAQRILLPSELGGVSVSGADGSPAPGPVDLPGVGDDPPSGSAGDPAALPEEGVQPADPATAEEGVRTAYLSLFDASRPREERSRFVDRPEVWIPANKALAEGEYGEAVRDQRAEVVEVVFTSPSHAAVRFHLVASSELVPQDDVIGDAVLVDGRWLVAIATPCGRISLAGIQCDYRL